MRPISDLPVFRSLAPLWHDPESRALLVTVLVQVTGGTVVFSLIEDWSVIDSFYFCVVTSTTIGYGDFTPTTEVGRLVCVVYIIISVGLVVALLSRIAMGRVERRAAAIEHRKSEPAPSLDA
ncbi:MAG: potassium channel family protein [Dehalococcoidia bacterium]